MANINFSLSALMGKHITFTVPLDLALLSIPNYSQYVGSTHQLSGKINGFSVLDEGLEILIDDEYYKISDVEILSVSDVKA